MQQQQRFGQSGFFQGDEKKLLVMSVERAILWHALDLTRRLCGQPKQVGALSIHNTVITLHYAQ